LANRVEIDVEPIFTNIDADVDSRLRASFGRFLTLHAGLAPNHLFRTSAKDGRTKLIHGPSQGAHGPARPTLGGWPSPERQLEIFTDSRQSEHARGDGARRVPTPARSPARGIRVFQYREWPPPEPGLTI